MLDCVEKEGRPDGSVPETQIPEVVQLIDADASHHVDPAEGVPREVRLHRWKVFLVLGAEGAELDDRIRQVVLCESCEQVVENRSHCPLSIRLRLFQQPTALFGH